MTPASKADQPYKASFVPDIPALSARRDPAAPPGKSR